MYNRNKLRYSAWIQLNVFMRRYFYNYRFWHLADHIKRGEVCCKRQAEVHLFNSVAVDIALAERLGIT